MRFVLTLLEIVQFSHFLTMPSTWDQQKSSLSVSTLELPLEALSLQVLKRSKLANLHLKLE